MTLGRKRAVERHGAAQSNLRRAHHTCIGSLFVVSVTIGIGAGTPPLHADPTAASPARKAAQAPKPGEPSYAVIIRHPETLGVVDTQLGDVNKTPVGIGCPTCHEPGGKAAIAEREGAPEEFHRGIRIQHGELRCQSCHAPEDRTRLRLADGTTLPFGEVISLCRQCHGPQTRDYEHGSHGGMTGYWDLRRGPRVRNSCVVCHSAHAPAIGQVLPAPPPRDRFLSPRHRSQPPARPGGQANREGGEDG